MGVAVVGFSTGALEKGDFRRAIDWIKRGQPEAIELSALRFEELQPLVDAIDSVAVEEIEYVSFHAPSSFQKEQESQVVELLSRVFERGWNIVVHPDVIYTPSLWLKFKEQLLVENMDRRKAIGRTAFELSKIFEELPEARLCLDVAHARNLDTTLGVLRDIVRQFAGRIAEIHISELDSRCQHRPLSAGAIKDYQRFSSVLRGIPVIIESVLDGHHESQRLKEVELAKESMAEYVPAYKDAYAGDRGVAG